jgi:uncharacterized protein (TIGR02147 family)
VFDYLDYRRFLKDALAVEKRSGRVSGLRDVAGYLGLKSPGHVSWILQGKRNLMKHQVPDMAKLLDLSAAEGRYLSLLVGHNDTGIPEERRRIFGQLVALHAGQKTLVGEEGVQYWTAWRNAVIREMVAIHSFRRNDAAKIGRLLVPEVAASKVEESLELLERLGMIRCGEDGFWHRTESVLSSGKAWTNQAIRNFQMSILELSTWALVEVPKDRRDISTVTFSISRERFRKVQTRVQEFREEILALCRTDPEPEVVYQLAVQLFPASSPVESGGS